MCPSIIDFGCSDYLLAMKGFNHNCASFVAHLEDNHDVDSLSTTVAPIIALGSLEDIPEVKSDLALFLHICIKY